MTTQTQSTDSTEGDGAITLNGRLFAARREDVETLLTAGVYSGHYTKTRSGGITLHDASGLRVGGINPNRVLHSSREVDGGWWHSYITPKVVGEYDSHCRELDEVRQALRVASEHSTKPLHRDDQRPAATRIQAIPDDQQPSLL